MGDKKEKIVCFEFSDSSIKLIVLEKSKVRVNIIFQESIELALGIVENGRVKKFSDLKDKILEMIDRAGLKKEEILKIVFVIPEEQSYIHVFKTRSLESELKEKAKKEIESILPLAANDLIFSFQTEVLEDADNNLYQIMIIASNRAVLNEWQELFYRLNIQIIAWEFETVAMFRGIYDELPQAPICLMDMKEDKTVISVFTPRGISYSYIYFLGYRQMQNAVGFSEQANEAAQYFREHNVMSGDGKKHRSLIKEFDKIIISLKNNISYFEHEQNDKVKELVLIGNFYKFNGLGKYLYKQTGFSAKLGQPFIKNIRPEFLAAAGGALKNIGKKKLIPGLSLDTGGSRDKTRIKPSRRRLKFFSAFALRRKQLGYIALAGLIIITLGLIISGALNKDNNKTVAKYRQHLKHEIELPLEPGAKNNSLAAEIIKVEISEAMEQTAAISLAKAKARESLAENLAISESPVNLPLAGKGLIYPYSFEFISYNEALARTECLAKLDSALKGAEFSLAGMALSVKKDLAGGYKLLCSLEFYTSGNINFMPKKEIVPKPRQKIVIKKSVLGNVNIRRGPGIQYEIISKVQANEEFELLEEKDAWVRIVIGEQEGWIISSVIRKIE